MATGALGNCPVSRVFWNAETLNAVNLLNFVINFSVFIPVQCFSVPILFTNSEHTIREGQELRFASRNCEHDICEVVAMSPARYARGGRAVSGILKALKQLNPANVQAESLRRVRLGVVGKAELLQEVAARLLGDNPEAYDKAGDSLILIATPLDPAAYQLLQHCDAILLSSSYTEPLPGVATERIFELKSADGLPSVIRCMLAEPGLAYAHLPLARTIPGFRAEVSQQIIQTVSIENAVFVASTSLGNVIPNPLQPLASVAEGLGDLVVLTANQLRMLFAIAAAYEKPVGYRKQAAEVGSIIAAAFGWRSMARELVGNIPLGGGVVPKAAIAFAGTWAIGDGIIYFYTTGKKLTKKELRERFAAAYEKGKAVTERIVEGVKESVYRRLQSKNEPGE